MKLKKIVSLALAGVMAVSMLAGCANNGGNGGNDSGKEPVTQPATGVAAAFNDAQSSTNKAKVVFSNDASIDAALAKAVKVEGQGASDQDVLGNVCYTTGLVNKGTWIFDCTINNKNVDNTDDSANGATATIVLAKKLNSTQNSVWSEDAAINKVASEINTMIANYLLDTTYSEKKGSETKEGETYYDYSYTGKASMVSVDNTDGTTDYYFFYVVTQTCKAEVLK